MSYAVPRTSNAIGASPLTQQHPGATVGSIDPANVDYNGLYSKLNKLGWLGVGGVASLGLAPGIGALSHGAGAAGAAGAGGAAAAAPTVAGGAAAAGAGAAGAGAAAGGGGMMSMILKAAIPLILGQVAGHYQKNAAGQASQGARLQDLLPLIMPMIQQQQQHDQQNYGQQQHQYEQIQPLQSAIAAMAKHLMPRGY